MKRLQVGEIAIDNVVEMDVGFAPDWLLVEGTADEIRTELTWLGPRLFDESTGELKLTVQSYLVRTPRRTILIDTGSGNGRERPSVPFFHRLDTPYLERLQALVAPEDVDIVLCSHLHVDHVGWNVRQAGDRFVPTFPNATYLFSAPEYEWWRGTHARGEGSAQAKAAFMECIEPLVRSGQARLVEPDHVVDQEGDTEIRLLELPGHTLHQVGVTFRSGHDRALFSADAAHHAVQFARPAWRSRPDTDKELGERTVRALIDRYCDTDVVILTGHATDPTACRLVSRGNEARLMFVEESP